MRPSVARAVELGRMQAPSAGWTNERGALQGARAVPRARRPARRVDPRGRVPCTRAGKGSFSYKLAVALTACT